MKIQYWIFARIKLVYHFDGFYGIGSNQLRSYYWTTRLENVYAVTNGCKCTMHWTPNKRLKIHFSIRFVVRSCSPRWSEIIHNLLLLCADALNLHEQWTETITNIIIIVIFIIQKHFRAHSLFIFLISAYHFDRHTDMCYIT